METETKKRVMLTVAYDGSNYNGWQIQPNGITIEGQLVSAFEQLTGETVTITGASRTDAGVHALCNKAVFDTSTRIPAEKLSYALNQYLPEDIRIRASEEVASDFHPRKMKSEKTYEYRILNAVFPDPTKRLYCYFTYYPLDVDAMRKAAAYLEGEHDFTTFSTFKPEVTDAVRSIRKITVEERVLGDIPIASEHTKLGQEREIVIRVTGNGFLYHMVRIIAGTLLEVGGGKRDPEEMEKLLEAKDRNLAGPTAPACGLTMVRHCFLE